MSAQRPQFDSHRFIKRLTTAGLAEEVAEILADEHTKLIAPHDVATKTDVAAVSDKVDKVKDDMATKAELSTDLDSVKAVMATKADVAAVNDKVDKLSADLDDLKAVMATKADVAAVNDKVDKVIADLDDVKAVMVTKADLQREIAACESRMEQRLQNAILEAKVSLIKWMIATMAVFSGIVIGAMTALQ